VRVVAGLAKGRRLKAPPGRETRPILDRVKLALFSWLEARSRLAGARVLDLYAGVGSLGIEALSRGAAAVLFVERFPRVAGFLRENLSVTGLQASAGVRVAPAGEEIDRLVVEGARFDLVFFDPPFAESRAEGLGEVGREMERAAGLLAEGGLVLLRCEGRVGPPARLGGLVLLDRRRWGRNSGAFYGRAEDGAVTGKENP